MQIVIDIPKEVYGHILKAKSVPDMLGIDIVNAINAIKNATPLPKGHGIKYEAKAITRGNCMMCGKELTEGLFFCKECEAKTI